MPELPEIEHLRRTLVRGGVIGARIVEVRLWRGGIVRQPRSRRPLRLPRPQRRIARDRDEDRRPERGSDDRARALRALLLEGMTIVDVIRRGKSLALIAARCGPGAANASGAPARPRENDPSRGAVLVLHMGMTGSLRLEDQSPAAGADPGRARRHHRADRHVHCEWVMERSKETGRRRDNETEFAGPRPSSSLGLSVSSSRPHTPSSRVFRLIFRDPRRFGGLWPFESLDELHARGWSHLGPDAFEPALSWRALRARLVRTRQPMKAALLNQALIAGVGNIYADEALFAAAIHPMAKPGDLGDDHWRRLARALRQVLKRAIAAGGSTIRDYVDADGVNGTYAGEHRVYGRAGQPCVRCGARLREGVVGQRTTVWCTRCQRTR